MTNSIAAEINLVINTETKNKKSIAGAVEETQAEINRKVSKALDPDNMLKGIVSSFFAIPRLLSSFTTVFKIIGGIALGALLAIPAIKGIYDFVDGLMSKDKESAGQENDANKLSYESSILDSISADQTKFAEDATKSYSQPYTAPVTQQLAEPSTISNSQNISESSAGLTSPTGVSEMIGKSEPITEQSKTIVTMDINDYEQKVSALNSIDMTTGISKLTSAIVKSVSDEKTNLISLFPVYGEFTNLLAKVVAQLQFISNPTLDNTKIIDSYKTNNMYSTSSDLYKQMMTDATNISQNSAGYYVYGNTIADAPSVGSATKNNAQQTSHYTETSAM